MNPLTLIMAIFYTSCTFLRPSPHLSGQSFTIIFNFCSRRPPAGWSGGPGTALRLGPPGWPAGGRRPQVLKFFGNHFLIFWLRILKFLIRSWSERTPYGPRTDPARIPNGSRADFERTSRGPRTVPKRIPNGPEWPKIHEVLFILTTATRHYSIVQQHF